MNAKKHVPEEPEYKVELRDIDDLVPYENNPRECTAKAVKKVKTSLLVYGFRQAIVATPTGEVIVGHKRLEAARELGLKRVPVHVADLSPEQVKAYRIADNRTHDETSWDLELLAAEITDLFEVNYDLSLLGFDPNELSGIIDSPTVGLTDPDLVPETPETPITQPGELIELGVHRLKCGDATSEADVKHLMAGERAVLMPSDWPYGLRYDGGNHPQTRTKAGRPITPEEKTKHWDDYQEPGALFDFYRATLRCARAVALGERPAIYTFFAMAQAPVVFAAWEAEGLLPHQVIIWAKSRTVLGRSDFAYNYEPCMYGWIQGQRPPAGRRPPAGTPALWQVSSAIEDGASGIHPTQKAIELIRRMVTYHTKPGELIYEPFLGSGTALIAAEMTGRRCYALEISPRFCDVAIQRWQNFTGKEVLRHGTRDQG